MKSGSCDIMTSLLLVSVRLSDVYGNPSRCVDVSNAYDNISVSDDVIVTLQNVNKGIHVYCLISYSNFIQIYF